MCRWHIPLPEITPVADPAVIPFQAVYFPTYQAADCLRIEDPEITSGNILSKNRGS